MDKRLHPFAAAVTGCLACSVVQAAESEVVGRGVVSTAAVEYGAAVDPVDGSLYFVRHEAPWGTPGCGRILRSTMEDGGWSAPDEILGGDACYGDPFISADGDRLYLTSDKHEDPERRDDDVWMMTRDRNGWENPRRIEEVSSKADEYSPVEAASGTLYFASAREGGLGQGDLWRAHKVGKGFATPENLGAPVSSPAGEWNLLVAPDESFLIIEISGRADGLSPAGDLYVSFAEGDRWTAPRPLAALNTPGSDLMPRLSPDGSALYYTSTKARSGTEVDIYVTPLAPLLAVYGQGERKQLAVVSRSNHELVLVDEETMTVAGRVATGRGPHEVAASPDSRHAFVPAYGVYPTPHDAPIPPSPPEFVEVDADTLRRIDLESATNGGSVDFRICSRSHGVTVTPDGHVWVTCEDEAAVLETDPETGATIKRWPAQTGTHQLAATPDNRYVVAANVDSGSITIVDRESGGVRHVETGRGAEGLALSIDGTTVWVGNGQAHTISIVAIVAGTVDYVLDSGGRFPVKLAMSPDGAEVWVVNTFSRSVVVFDSRTRSPIDTLQFDSPPLGVGFAPEGDRVYLTFPRLNEVRAFDRRSRQLVGTVSGIMEADGLAFTRRAVPRAGF